MLLASCTYFLKRSKEWTFLITGEFTDRLERLIIGEVHVAQYGTFKFGLQFKVLSFAKEEDTRFPSHELS